MTDENLLPIVQVKNAGDRLYIPTYTVFDAYLKNIDRFKVEWVRFKDAIVYTSLCKEEFSPKSLTIVKNKRNMLFIPSQIEQQSGIKHLDFVEVSSKREMNGFKIIIKKVKCEKETI